MIRKKVGFIGSGYMGFGMAKNLIKNFDVFVIAHKNRDPINKLVDLGAKEILNYNDLLNNNLDSANEIVARFRELDVDGSGQLDGEEARVGLREMKTATGRNLSEKVRREGGRTYQ